MNKPEIRWRKPVYIPQPLTPTEREALAREALAQRMASAISAACWGGIVVLLLLLVLA